MIFFIFFYSTYVICVLHIIEIRSMLIKQPVCFVCIPIRIVLMTHTDCAHWTDAHWERTGLARLFCVLYNAKQFTIILLIPYEVLVVVGVNFLRLDKNT